MPVDWPFANKLLKLGGAHQLRIELHDADRQTITVRELLAGLRNQPGMVLCDEVGMGKTYVALSAAASVMVATRGRPPVVVMVPGRLRRKWQREWHQFKRHCTVDGALDFVRDGYAHSPTEFFKLLDDGRQHRKHLIFVTTGCFSSGLDDPWIRLAFIQLARRRMRLSSPQKRRIYRWAANLVRLASKRGKLTIDLVEALIKTDCDRWKDLLVPAGLLDKDADDPVPAMLTKCQKKIDWQPLIDVLRRELPKRESPNLTARLKDAREAFNKACRKIYKQWMERSKWQSSLLILDEAHHAKNDQTRLAKLFRNASDKDVALLGGKFQRMLFLTATPFQLGHEELIRVLLSFAAVRFNGDLAPAGDRDGFEATIGRLHEALDANRRAGRHLDRLWGTICPEMLDGQDVGQWWARVRQAPADDCQRRLVDAIDECRKTRDVAQALLRPWLIRHNRPAHLPAAGGASAMPRRHAVVGCAVLDDGEIELSREIGLPIANEAALPFLLTARAQGELAQISGARAYFAEGLASSYEAFHDTRKDRKSSRDMSDDGAAIEPHTEDTQAESHQLSTAWYEEQIARLVPSRSASCLRSERLAHPKISATVRRVVDLWAGGEKVLVFCFYRHTCQALYEHIREEIHARTLAIAREKLGGNLGDGELEQYLARIARRFSDAESPFHQAVQALLSGQLDAGKYRSLPREKLIKVLAAYFRAPSFLARYLPLDDPAVRRAWEYGERRADVIEPGLAALQRAVTKETDRSNQTFQQRVGQFLDYALELHERAEHRSSESESDDEPEDPLDACLEAVGVFSRPRNAQDQEREDEAGEDEPEDDEPVAEDDGAFRAAPLVRRVHGETPSTTRDRLALAFNSPLFPEVLVSSSVMGEGIDLHRFCRHVIHHDGYWNPSVLEQQTGRLDRIRCKAEMCGMPIVVYQPFLAGGADEKMFRVVRDRERWFQVVMGQKFQFDEATSDELAARVPLPQSLAKELTFDLARWKTPPVV